MKMDGLLDQLTKFLLDLVLYIPRKVWQWLTEAIVTVLEAIPVPDWLANAQVSMSNIPSGVLWFASLIELSTGVAIIISAYVIRFLIRRIPIIG